MLISPAFCKSSTLFFSAPTSYAVDINFIHFNICTEMGHIVTPFADSCRAHHLLLQWKQWSKYKIDGLFPFLPNVHLMANRCIFLILLSSLSMDNVSYNGAWSVTLAPLFFFLLWPFWWSFPKFSSKEKNVQKIVWFGVQSFGSRTGTLLCGL